MPASESTRCILLAPPGRARTVDRSGMSERTWDVSSFEDTYLAMAELALSERAQVARSAWGLQRVARVVLVVSEPDECPCIEALLAAVDKYLPTVCVFFCKQGRLEPVANLSKRTAPPQQRSIEPARPSRIESTTISRDELDMLLEMGSTDQ